MHLELLFLFWGKICTTPLLSHPNGLLILLLLLLLFSLAAAPAPSVPGVGAVGAGNGRWGPGTCCALAAAPASFIQNSSGFPSFHTPHKGFSFPGGSSKSFGVRDGERGRKCKLRMNRTEHILPTPKGGRAGGGFPARPQGYPKGQESWEGPQEFSPSSQSD